MREPRIAVLVQLDARCVLLHHLASSRRLITTTLSLTGDASNLIGCLLTHQLPFQVCAIPLGNSSQADCLPLDVPPAHITYRPTLRPTSAAPTFFCSLNTFTMVAALNMPLPSTAVHTPALAPDQARLRALARQMHLTIARFRLLRAV